MKATLLTLVLATFLVGASNAQGFHLGVKGGANINKMDGKSFKDEFSYGYHLGGFAEIGLGKKFSIQPEVLFNQISHDTTAQFNDIYDNLFSSNRSGIRLNYLTIPLLLSYRPSSFLSLQAGPQFGIVMDQSRNLIDNGKEAFKNDLSMLAGVQLKLGAFRVYGRYAIGLNNVNDIDNQDKWKSQGFQIGLGLAIL